MRWAQTKSANEHFMKQNQQFSAEVAKLSYETPSLVCLGSVEELTLAKAGGTDDTTNSA